MTGEHVLQVNMDAIVLNIIRDALWDGRTYEESIAFSAEHFSKFSEMGLYVIPYEYAHKEIKKAWDNIYQSQSALNSLITRDRKITIKPHYKNNDEYVGGEINNDLSCVRELFDVIHRIGQ